MKKRIRNVLIGFFHYAGIAWFYRMLMRGRGPLTRIIVFHDIPSGPWFASLMEELTRTARILTPDEFVSGVRDSKRLNVLVTFDDGYASWVTHALPALAREKIHALFFITSGILDSTEKEGGADAFMREKLMIRPRIPLTWDGARTLMGEGHTVGGHAYTHANLSTMSGEELSREIIDDKQALEARLGTTLTHFAYPFGTRFHFTPATSKAVEGAGYTHAYTAISRFVKKEDGTFLISRMCIEDGMTPAKLSLWMDGGYDLFDMLKSLCVR